MLEVEGFLNTRNKILVLLQSGEGKEAVAKLKLIDCLPSKLQALHAQVVNSVRIPAHGQTNSSAEL